MAAPWFNPPILALGWAIFLGGCLQLAIQLPALKKIGMLPRWGVDWRDPGVRRILKLMGPAILGVSVSQISLIINTIFASFLGTGSVSWLYYADRLMEFPSGLLGVALGTILLPSLSKYHASAQPEEYSKLLDWGLRLCFLLTLPAALALAILGIPLVATLFHHGAFGTADVLHTRDALAAYSIGLIGLILVKVLAPGFYARQNIRTPVKIALASLLVTQAMNLAFIWPLRHAGLALSIGLAACFNATLLYRGLRRHGIFQPQPGWGLFFLRQFSALAVLGAVLWFGMPWLLFLFVAGHTLAGLERAIWLCFFASLVFGFDELRRGFILQWGSLFFFGACLVLVNWQQNIWVATHMTLIANSALTAIMSSSKEKRSVGSTAVDGKGGPALKPELRCCSAAAGAAYGCFKGRGPAGENFPPPGPFAGGKLPAKPG